MSFRKGSLAKATSATVGSGTLTLVNVAAEYDSFLGAFGAGPRVVQYVIRGSGYREQGVGVWDSAGPNTLTRVSVLRSSAGGSLVALPAGTHDVYAWEGAQWQVDVLTGSPSLTLADLFSGQLYTGTGGTLSLPALAGLPPGIAFPVYHLGTGTLTIDPSGAETINGASTLALPAGSCVWIQNRDTATAQWIALVALSTVPASLAAAQTFTAAQIISGAGLTPLTLVSTDAGAGEGPILDLHRDSASPAASDVIGSLLFSMESSTSVKRSAAKIVPTILDATNASEDATLALQTIVAGTLATRATVGQGVFLAGTSDPGAGILNATGLQIGGVSIVPQLARAFGQFTFGGVTNRSFNITSISDAGTGRIGVTIATDFPTAEWICCTDVEHTAAQSPIYNSMAAGTVELRNFDSAGTAFDVTNQSFVGFDQ